MQQAHQLFQRDAQTITPETLQSVKAAGQTWEDPTLTNRPESTCEFLHFFLSFFQAFIYPCFIYLLMYICLPHLESQQCFYLI
jgi:hypothetical protein